MDFNSIDMRKIIISCILICSSTFVDAQNNLVFNQVLAFSVSTNTTATVPQGKVWKIEYSGASLIINHIDVLYGGPIVNQNFYSTSNGQNAIWLPEGATLSSNGSTGTRISALEFNVVPISSSGGSGSVDPGSGSSNGSLPGDDYTPGDSFSDTDGNIYETVEVNGQTWTTTNLNVSTYRDGTPIPYISDFDEWNSTSTGAYTYAGQDSGAGSGKLYNVFALAGLHDNDGATPNKILAPEGYHIPSPLEWKALINSYISNGSFNFSESGMSNNYLADIASSFLKSQTSWNNNGTNESGLDIKNYPIIYGSNTESNSNFSNVIYLGNTQFATNQIILYGNNDLRFNGIVIGEFILDEVLLLGYPNNDNTSDSGFYIRLIKDY